MTRVRYIGFDMDDCVGNVHAIYPFTNAFLTRNPAEVSFVERVVERFAACEIKRRTGFIRPAMLSVLPVVYSAIRSGQIEGGFLFSNNSNHSLVLFIKRALEEIAKQLLHLSQPPSLFRMSISVQSPERGPRTGVKDWESIGRCLKHHGLPLPDSRRDLLFFDDKQHVLTGEIPHYTVVPAYHRASDLEDFLKCVHDTPGSPPHWTSWMASRIRTRFHTPDPVPTEDVGTPVFLEAIQRFLRSTPSKHSTSPSKKQKQKRNRRTRKNLHLR
jgi:hypothetical protein